MRTSRLSRKRQSPRGGDAPWLWLIPRTSKPPCRPGSSPPMATLAVWWKVMKRILFNAWIPPIQRRENVLEMTWRGLGLRPLLLPVIPKVRWPRFCSFSSPKVCLVEVLPKRRIECGCLSQIVSTRSGPSNGSRSRCRHQLEEMVGSSLQNGSNNAGDKPQDCLKRRPMTPPVYLHSRPEEIAISWSGLTLKLSQFLFVLP